MTAEEFKKKGNDAFNRFEYEEAIKHYTEAIKLDPNRAVYYSNRAAVYATQKDNQSALDDANTCIQVDPNFVKGYSRKGQALVDMEQYAEAEEAYTKGLRIEPTNEKCQKGLHDVQQKRRQHRQEEKRAFFEESSSTRAPPREEPEDYSSSSNSSSDEGFFQTIIDKLQSSGIAGKIIVCAVVAALYLGYTWIFEEGPSTDKPAGKDSADDTSQADHSFQPIMKRHFLEAKTSWLSYMELQSEEEGETGDTLLLLLHRTPLSAESEFGEFLPEIVEKTGADDSLPGGVHMLAPDRPCHGYSTCPASGSPTDGAWLNKLISKVSTPQRLVLVAAGKEASLQAISLCRKRFEPVYIVLISPRSKAPRPRVTSGAPLFQWLNRTSEDMTIRAAADTALWTSHALSDPNAKSPTVTQHVTLPKGSKITMLYLTGDQQVDDVEYELDLTTKGSLVQVRWCPSSTLTSEALISAIWEMLPVGLESAADEEFDDTL